MARYARTLSPSAVPSFLGQPSSGPKCEDLCSRSGLGLTEPARGRAPQEGRLRLGISAGSPVHPAVARSVQSSEVALYSFSFLVQIFTRQVVVYSLARWDAKGAAELVTFV